MVTFSRLIVTASLVSLIALASCSQQPPIPIYKDSNRPAAERAADLLRRLSVEQKAKLMMDRSEAIDSLGVPVFHWWSEALHGVGRNGLATMWPQCIGLAATFDSALVYQLYSATSDEARAKNTAARHSGLPLQRMQGLSFWTPNVNVFRDPRWGRGQETYGEDPWLNALMGRQVVGGLQGPKGSKYRKLLACAKHFAVHSGPEKTRHTLDLRDISRRDMRETYLPAFKSLVMDANVAEVMCAYQRIDGQPCCGNNVLLNDILRKEWGFNGVVVSDCGAIRDFYQAGCHEVVPDATGASAQAVKSGCDIECGSEYKHIPDAVRSGQLSEEDLDRSLLRLLTLRFELGDFDPDELIEWTKLTPEVVSTPAHRALAAQAARESIVLLTNKNNTLPLDPTTGDVMVMGPNAADSLVMWGIYYGTPAHTVTALEGIRETLPGVAYVQGCGLTEATVPESMFALISCNGQPGLQATYYNTPEPQGQAAATLQYTSPIHLDNGGNTAFAQGVEAEGFSLTLKGELTAERDETLYIDYNHDQWLTLVVGGDTLHNRRNDYMKSDRKELKVKKGQVVPIALTYKQRQGSASLGFDVVREKNVAVKEAVAAAQKVGTVIFVGGISPLYEREEAKTTAIGFDHGDRTSIQLPAVQRQLLQALHAAGKRVVFVCCSGSAVALAPELESCDAILQLWYAGEQGGTALSDVLFGRYNPSARLPVTFYANDNDLPPFDDYAMKAGLGRTYRYFKGQPVFPFGHGLSYTSFEYGDLTWDAQRGGVKLNVTNTGKVKGDDVVLCYIKDPSDIGGPLRSLRGVTRVSLEPGASTEAFIPLPPQAFELYDEAAGDMKVKPGIIYEVSVADQTIGVKP